MLRQLRHCLFGYAPASVRDGIRALETAHQQAKADLLVQLLAAQIGAERLRRELHRHEQDFASGELAIQTALRCSWLDRALVAAVGGRRNELAGIAADATPPQSVGSAIRCAEAEVAWLTQLQSQLATDRTHLRPQP